MKGRFLLGMVGALLVANTMFSALPADARIKLATLPQRERVEIQLDNGNYTLVEEERIVTLLKSTPETGNNKIDFSWSNTRIDKDTILFRPIAIKEGDKFRAIKKIKIGQKEADEVSVINVAYPPNENALVWEVYANDACALKVRVSYLITNLDRSFHYQALANKGETELILKNYIKLHNFSGEEFDSAGLWAGFGPKYKKEIGQEEEIKMLIEKFEKVPIQKTFDFDWYVNGSLNPDKPFASKIQMYYELVNDKDHKLGKFPLQPGKVRIFIEDGKGGQAFLGEDWARLTPIDDKMKLYLGEARDIVCTRKISKNENHRVRGQLYNKEIVIKYEIENFKDEECVLRIKERLNNIATEYFGRIHGDVEWEKGEQTSKEIEFDFEDGGVTPILKIKLPARPKDKEKKVEKKEIVLHLMIKNLWY